MYNLIDLFFAHNIKVYIVGGYVRDFFLEKSSSDRDICLVGSTPELTTEILESAFKSGFISKYTPNVGTNVGTWIVELENKLKIDITLCRGNSIEEDLKYRDFTINSMALQVKKQKHCLELIDPYNGKIDLKNRILRHTSEYLAEDPLRIVRAARFCSTYNLTPSTELIEFCKQIDISDVDLGRVGRELWKVFSSNSSTTIFFNFLKDVGKLEYCFKELYDLIGIQQDKVHHPEGDAYNHTLLCIEQAKTPFMKVVMLCHDLGKAVVTKFDTIKNRWVAYGHEDESVPLTMNLLNRLQLFNSSDKRKVCVLVKHHMIHTKKPLSDYTVHNTVYKLNIENLTYDDLLEVCIADLGGRFPLEGYIPDIRQEYAKTVNITPLVTGKDLIALGYKPSKLFKEVLDRMLYLQFKGKLDEQNKIEKTKQVYESRKTVVEKYNR